jgi:hypothetical protein
MENKQMEVQQPSFGVPIGLQYRLSIADAVPSSHNISQFLASNASDFTPSNNTIRINVSSGAFLDLKNAVLEFDLKNTTGTDPCRLDGGAGCVINRIRILSSDGSEIERIDSYNLLDCIIDQYTASDGDARIKSAQKGAPRFSDDTPAFDEASSGALNTGEVSASPYETGLTIKGTQTDAADTAGKLQLKIVGVGGIGYDPRQADVLDTDITRHYSFGLKCGFFNPSTAKLLPPNTPFQVEITLGQAADCLVNLAGTNAVNYQVNNAELHIPAVVVNDPNYMAMVNQRLAQGISYKCNSYDHYVNTSAASTGKDVVQISARARSLKGLMTVIRHQSKVSSDDDYKLSKRSIQYVSDYQYKVGSNNYPVDRVNLKTDTTAGGTASGTRLPLSSTADLNIAEAYNHALRLFGSLNLSNANIQIGQESFAQSENANNNGAGILAMNLSAFSDGSVNSGLNTLNNMPVSLEFTKTAAVSTRVLQLDSFAIKELVVMRDGNGVLSSMS